MRRTLSGLVSMLALAALAAAPAPAQAQGVNTTALDAAIQTAASVKQGDAAGYAAARAQITALGEAALPALAARGADGNWTATGWRQALVAEAARLRIARPEIAAVVDAPRGIDPATYKKFRKPEPICQHDLTRLGREAVPLLLERLLWTLDAKPFSGGAAGEKERRALLNATLYAPGHHGDPRARFAMEEALLDTSRSTDERRHAAVSAAQCGGAATLPALKLLLDSPQPLEVRAACAWALGRIPTVEAADALTARLAKTSEKDAALSAAVLNGLGILGDKWAWESRGAAAADTALSLRARCAAALVGALRTHPSQREMIGTALAQTAWPESLAQVRALASDEGAPAEAREAAAAVAPALEMALGR